MSDTRDVGSGPSLPPVGQRLLTLRIIAASMGMGVTLFAGVAWFAQLETPPPLVGTGSGLLFGALLVLAVLMLLGAVAFWRARIAPLIEPALRGRDHDTSRPRSGARVDLLQTRLIITWALIEAPALAGIALYYLYGDAISGILGLLVIWVGIGLTWPRRGWLEDPRP